MEVDLPRKRVGLSMRLTDEAVKDNKPGKADEAKNKPASKQHKQGNKQTSRQTHKPSKPKTRSDQPINSAMADAFAKLKN